MASIYLRGASHANQKYKDPIYHYYNSPKSVNQSKIFTTGNGTPKGGLSITNIGDALDRSKQSANQKLVLPKNHIPFVSSSAFNDKPGVASTGNKRSIQEDRGKLFPPEASSGLRKNRSKGSEVKARPMILMDN